MKLVGDALRSGLQQLPEVAPEEPGPAIDLLELGVPARIVEALGARFHSTEAVVVTRAWQATSAGLLVLTGTVGCGKSVAAGAALQSNIRRRTVRLIDAEPIEVVEPLSGRWVLAEDLAKASDYADDFWRPLRSVDLLVVDEVDPRWLDPKGRALTNFLGLLRRRDDDARRTILTTNLSPNEWMQIYGDADGGRLRSRLLQAETDLGRPVLVALTGPSLRGGRNMGPTSLEVGQP